MTRFLYLNVDQNIETNLSKQAISDANKRNGIAKRLIKKLVRFSILKINQEIVVLILVKRIKIR
jgi:hypothetical protein